MQWMLIQELLSYASYLVSIVLNIVFSLAIMSIEEVIILWITSSFISIEGKMSDFNANIIAVRR